MNDQEAENTKASIAHQEDNGLLSNLLNLIFITTIVFVLLWNWDGFWQTGIRPLTNAQKHLFPEKHKQEQQKLERITRNNHILNDFEIRLNAYEEQATKAREELERYRAAENLKCRYYETSLSIIRHLTKKYSEEEIKRQVSCTNKECEEILTGSAAARLVCE